MTKVKLLIIIVCCAHLFCFLVVQCAIVLNKKPQPSLNSYATYKIVEGDILSSQSASDILRKKFQAQFAASTAEPLKLWKDAIIPIEFDPELKPHEPLIITAITHIVLQSCVFFRHKQPEDKHFVKIHKGTGCWASLGFDPIIEHNQVSLGDGCYYFGTIVHELMHTLGFNHEHKRHDRDLYLIINKDNIIDSNETLRQFKANKAPEEKLLTRFDFNSIMLYGAYEFSIGGNLPTIESKFPGQNLTDSKDKTSLSPLDVESINLLYNCTHAHRFYCSKFDKACCFYAKSTSNMPYFLYELRRVKCPSNEVIIYSKLNNGCLDVGFNVDYGFIMYSNTNCEAGVNWQFEQNGELRANYLGFRKKRKMCLDCVDGTENCFLIGRDCNGLQNQQFFIQFHPNFYFSINSQLFPSRCLTLVENPANFSLFMEYQGNAAFQLEECTGKASQLFYWEKVTGDFPI